MLIHKKNIFFITIITIIAPLNSVYAQQNSIICTKKSSNSNKMAISNAKLFNRIIINTHKQLIDSGCWHPEPNHISGTIDGFHPFLKSLYPELKNIINPFYNFNIYRYPQFAFDTNVNHIFDISIPDSSSNANSLGVVQGYYKPRNPSTGSPPVVCTSVYVSQPFLDPSIGITQVFSLFSYIDESEYDDLAKKYAARIHQQIKTRYKRAKALSLPMASAIEFQMSIFGRGPNHTEVPDYWILQNPSRRKPPICNAIIINETSENATEIQQIGYPYDFWKINISYFPGSETSLPVLTTAVYLAHSLETTQGNYSNIFTLQSQLF